MIGMYNDEIEVYHKQSSDDGLLGTTHTWQKVRNFWGTVVTSSGNATTKEDRDEAVTTVKITMVNVDVDIDYGNTLLIHNGRKYAPSTSVILPKTINYLHERLTFKAVEVTNHNSEYYRV